MSESDWRFDGLQYVCKRCGSKSWQDQDGNHRMNHKRHCVSTERTTGKGAALQEADDE